MLILGFSCHYHNSAAALVADGEIIAAVEEERLSRLKNDPRFPAQAISACLETTNSTMDDVDLVAFYEKPHRKLARVLSTAIRTYPAGREHFTEVLAKWGRESFWSPGEVRDQLLALSPSRGARARWDRRFLFVPHHLSHAASAFYPSPFTDAAVLVTDGVGEFSTTTIGEGSPRTGLRLVSELRFPHSLGLVYSSFTHFLGFQVNEGEYKVMGLAPYGEPRFRDTIADAVVRPHADGSFAVNESLFTYHVDRRMYDVPAMERLFGPRRVPGAELTQVHADIAASIQVVTEELLLRLAERAHRETGRTKLVLAGGVALNCVANGRILREGPFDDVWVPPSPGDAGGAVGAALQAWHGHAGGRAATPRRAGADGMSGTRLGPRYSTREVRAALSEHDLGHVVLPPQDITATVARLLADGKIVGWFHGRLEFGPRALGGRSILADPRSPEMQRILNLRVKRRESFRPFAAAVPRDRAGEWFQLEGRPGSVLGAPGAGYDTPYMTLVAPVHPARAFELADPVRRLGGLDVARNEIPSCTHVDGSSRVQTVTAQDDWLFHELLVEFEKITSVPVLLNTSFNRRGEPIVCSPQDAVECFLDTDIDYLCMEDTISWKTPAAELPG